MEERESLAPLTDSEMKLLEEATRSYQADLLLADGVMEYLNARGISEREAGIRRVGVASDPVPGHERFRGFLAIPYLDRRGRPLTIRFRCVEKHDHREHGHGKYMSLPDDVPRMFNVGAVFEADDTIHVCEGEFDAIVLNSIGLPAVAIPGAHLWRPRHRVMLSGFQNIYVWADPDQAGMDLLRKIMKSLPNAKPVRLTGGDVSEVFVEGGAEALLARLAESV